MTNDPFYAHAETLEGPAAFATEVSPSDTDDLKQYSRALYVGAAGDLKVTMASGEEVTFAGVGAGIFPIRVSRVHSTGTTADEIVALW